jgi:hypothetical protein
VTSRDPDDVDDGLVDMLRFSDEPGAPPFADPDPPRPPEAAWSAALAQALNPATTADEDLVPAEHPDAETAPADAVGEPSSGSADDWPDTEVTDDLGGALHGAEDPPDGIEDEPW